MLNVNQRYKSNTTTTKIHVPYAQLLPYLVPKEIPLVVSPYGPKHNPNAYCAFHASYIWHSTDDCRLFKSRVQQLIDQKILSFFEEGPNIRTNPFPTHDGPMVNVVIEEECTKMIRGVTSVGEYRGQSRQQHYIV